MFKHYLEFIDLPLIGKIEISEPFKFDGSTHEIKKEKGRFARDLIIANPDIELEVHREHFELLDHNQVLPNGTIFNVATHGFDYLINEINTKGWELSINYIINYNGTNFKTGEINGLTFKVYENYLTIKISQNSLSSFIKKNESVKINAFSNKSLTDAAITPCQTTDIFLKAKPITQLSEWEELDEVFFPNIGGLAFPFRSLKKFGIEDSLVPFYYFSGDPAENPCVRAKTKLTDVKISIDFDYFIDFDLALNQNEFRVEIVVWNESTTTIISENFINLNLVTGVWQNFSADFQIDVINQSLMLTVAVMCIDTKFKNAKLSITANSEAVSTIVKGVRLFDLLQHQADSFDTQLFDNNVFNENSEHWDNFCFNGRMLANLNDKPFTNEFKDLFKSVCNEAGADYQIKENGIAIKKISDFYADVEIAQFTEIPSKETNYTANTDFSANIFNVEFKKSSSERTGNSEDTSDDVHTSLQLKMPSKKADLDYKIEIEHIRSAQLIEEQRRKGNEVNGKTRTLENDEQLFILDCVPLEEGTINKFSQFCTYRVIYTTNVLEIISSGTFSWNNLGFELGQIISIETDIFTTGSNFEILELTDFMIKLEFQNNLPPTDFSGQSTFIFEYELQGVLYTNRTNEGFDAIEGVAVPNNYSNLRYTPRRILNNWSEVVNTAGQYLIGKSAKVTEIKVNDTLVTRLDSETSSVVEKGNFLITESRLINGRIFEVDVFCDFDKATYLFLDTNNVSGYISVTLANGKIIKGYIKEANYTWVSSKLKLTLEERIDNLITEINTFEIDHFIIMNNFVSLYNSNNELLTEIKEFTKFSINGIIFSNLDLFTENLITLSNE